jgi:hypothetical protein
MSDELRKILGVLAPYLSDVVIIGGWVPELYRLYGGVTWRTVPSRTTELDVLVEPRLDPAGRPKLRERLEDAGIRPARNEPFPADWVSADSDATVVEFLMQRPGPFNSDSPRQIDLQGWLGAILVDDVQVLREFTHVLPVQIGNERWDVRVPTLGAWAVGKALSFGARPALAEQDPNADKRAKDLVYLRDLIFAGPEVLAQVGDDLKAVASVKSGRAAMQRAVTQLSAPHEATLSNAARRLSTRDSRPMATARAEIINAEKFLIELVNGATSV